MFKNKILVKATPSPSHSSFFLLPLSLPSSSCTTGPPLSVDLEILSWKLSRKLRLACLTQPFEILVVYQKSQSDLVDRVVSEFLKFDPLIRIGVEEEVKSVSVIAKAIEIGLRCVMLDNNWTCIGDNTFVKSTFSTSEERSNVYAVNVQVQSGDSDDVIFLVSPDTLRFSRHQISDLMSSKNVDELNNMREVILESFNFSMACTTLPSLSEGYFVGVSKVPPEGESVNNFEDLWSIKHGLTLKSNHYVAVQFLYGGSTNKTWIPSAFVLQGSGLTPAPKTIRVSKAMLAFQSFIKLLEAWDFFGGGSLIAKEQSLIGSGAGTCSWEKITHNLPQCIINPGFICKDPLSALDFRTPKPDIGYSTEKNTLDRNKENSLLLTDSDSKDASSTINEAQIGLNDMAAVKSVLPGSKREDAQKAIQDTCQKKNETVLVSSPTKCPPKTQTYTGAARADQNAKSTQCNARSTSVGSVKPTKKNVATPDNKFTADTRIVKKLEKRAWKLEKQNKVPTKRRIQQSVEWMFKRNTLILLGVIVQTTSKPVIPCYCFAKDEESTEVYLTKAKAKPKQSLDKDEVTAKVLNCHKRGQLQSLTVADLKCFLCCKKAKVGGTKEELIRRVTGFLD
ncbi:SAP domain-containing protein [Carex littledalei]|uniref:SAP domain-containing protein n=1 Tax=Carex littledalei TaxID=544730 RepID=A0A833VRQ1_9POAL|nr:SAP domain-containing protein [Carex littledalei]